MKKIILVKGELRMKLEILKRYMSDLTGDNHVTCIQLSKPDVATLSYRRSHYWWQKERCVTVVFVQVSVFCVN